MLASTINLMPDKTVIPLLGIFLIVLFFLNYFLFRPVLRILDLRWEKTEGETVRAKDLDRATDELNAEIIQRIEDVRKQGSLTRRMLRKEAEDLAREIVENSKRQRESILRESRQNVDRMRGDLAKELEQQIPKISRIIEEYAFLEKKGV